jgi:hypothetical protein
MNYEAMFPSRFLKAADLQGKDQTVKIGGIKLEKMPDGKVKGIITFEGTDKEWLLNRSNAEALKLMWGVETNDWLHKRLTLCVRQVDAFGESVPAVRVKGSPDIDKPMTSVVTRGNGQRQKTIKIELVPTAKDAKGKA